MDLASKAKTAECSRRPSISYTNLLRFVPDNIITAPQKSTRSYWGLPPCDSVD